jgi:hypothetical protein
LGDNLKFKKKEKEKETKSSSNFEAISYTHTALQKMSASVLGLFETCQQYLFRKENHTLKGAINQSNVLKTTIAFKS